MSSIRNHQYENSGTDDNDNDSDSAEFQLGTISGYTYENEFFGIGCTLDNWEYVEREELLKGTETAAEFIEFVGDNDKLAEALRGAAVFKEMQANSPDGNSNVNIMIQNAGVDVGFLYDEEGFMKEMEKQVQTELNGENVAIKSTQVAKYKFAGEDKYALDYSMSVMDVSLQLRQFVYFVDEYCVTITITADNISKIEEICKAFYRL